MIDHSLLPAPMLFLGWTLYLLLLLCAIWRAPWLELFTDSRRQHLLLASVCGLALLWLLRHDFASGLSYQLMGLTAVTLLLDWPLALLAGFLAQLALLAVSGKNAAALGLNGLLMVALPIATARACAAAVEHFAPRNLFVYIFFCAFFPAALTVLVVLLAGFCLLLVGGRFILPPGLSELAGYLWLLMFPEAFINGAVISALVIFHPDVLETFNRTRYLAAPWKQKEE